MLTKEQYDLLKYMLENPEMTYANILKFGSPANYRRNKEIADRLKENKYISLDWNDTMNRPVTVTQAGKEALEEYEAAQRSERRDDESLEAVKRELELHRREIKYTMIWSGVNSILTVVSIGISLYSIFYG